MALEAALAEHGRRVEDLERLVVTHQHIDHIGLTQILADRSGAEVCALDALAPWLARYADGMEEDDAFSQAVMHRHGIPDDVVLALRAVSRGFRWAVPNTTSHQGALTPKLRVWSWKWCSMCRRRSFRPRPERGETWCTA